MPSRVQKLQMSGFSIGALLLASIFLFQPGTIHAVDEGSGSQSTRFCFHGNGLFSFDDIPGWTFGNAGEDELSAHCIRAERMIGTDKVATLSVRFSANNTTWTAEKLTGLSTEDVKAMQARKGDPLLIGDTEFTVNKLFANETHEQLGFFSFATAKVGGGTLVVTLFSTTREGHDKNYQQFRDWVRTFKKTSDSAAGVSH